ncbi:MAG TPA: tagaturonate reductase [Candidatus Tetragenococcus pullicola]|nr:tagaturonate reductase [Candidatus Tetragenococcus pullicola]
MTLEKISTDRIEPNPNPVRALQFGEGNFMRAFIDWQLQQLNKKDLFNGKVTVVQPIDRGLADMLNEQDDRYTVILEGLLDGQVIQDFEIITVIDDVIDPYKRWQDYLAQAENDELAFIFSNTTEAGIAYHEGDQLTDTPPQSYPAKLTAFLYKRWELKKPGFTIIPCELIDRNGDKLKEIVLRYANDWQLPTEFKTWIDTENVFCCSLVDRIVPGYPRDNAEEFWDKMGYQDPLMVKAEPFLLWVIEGPQSLKESLPLAKAGLNVIVTDDMTPYRERKVHLLNGPHTAMVSLALLADIQTVEEVMKDADFRPFVDDLFSKELIPMVDLPQKELESYAEQIKERFLNPFANHQLTSILLNSVSKFSARLLPILTKFEAEKQTVPAHIAAALAGLIVLYRGDKIKPTDDKEALDAFEQAWKNPTTVAQDILSNDSLWGMDLTTLPDLATTVQTDVTILLEKGARELVKQLKGEI